MPRSLGSDLSPCLCLLLLLGSPLALAGKAAPAGPEALALEKRPLPLLGGRLLLRVPAGMRPEARQASIMAAPEAGEDETRLVLDHAGVRLVVMAHELYARAGVDLLGSVQAEVEAGWGDAAEGCKLERLKLAHPLEAVVNTPPAPDGKRSANLVLGVYVKGADGLVQFLAFYVSPEGVPASQAWAGLGRRMAASLTAGARKLELAAGTRQLKGQSGHGLEFQVPAGSSLIRQAGPDFVVHHLRLLAPLGEAGPSCGVYQGGHPGFQHRQQGVPPGQVRVEPGELLGQKTDWQRWALAGRHVLEAIAPLPTGHGDGHGHAHGPREMVHVFCSAGSAEALTPLAATLRTLKVTHEH
jgi:hypothetical protein